MKRSIHILLSFFLAISSLHVHAGDSTGVVLHISKERVDENNVILSIKATIPSHAKLYALETPDNKTLFSSVSFDTVYKKYLSGAIEEKGYSLSEKDSSVDATVKYFLDSVLWQQKLHILSSDSLQLKGTINYLYKKGDEYLPGEKEFKIPIGPESSVSTNTEPLLANRSLL